MQGWTAQSEFLNVRIVTIKSVIWKCVSRKQRTIWIHSEGYCRRVNWNKQIYGAQQWKEQAIAGTNMPGACLTSIKVKSLIALIISVPLHFKQPLALPKYFNCAGRIVALLGRDIRKGDKEKEAEVQTCIFRRNGSNEYPEVKKWNNYKSPSLHQ